MAEIWPNEGIDLVLANAGFATSGVSPVNTWLALFNTFTASTVGTSASVALSYTEPGAGSYARQTISSASWGAIGSTTSGRTSACAQVSFPVATAAYTGGALNGFWLANSLTVGKTYFAANFDDTTAVTINSSDQIKVTPTVILGG